MTEARKPIDEHIRREVIDPSRSFAVQAPAGSGKTELLTQRFLRLLGVVDRPQKVLAITFTRKATREMLDRVLERLRGAAAGQTPESAHQAKAHDLALRVLEQDRRHGWGLLEDPAQLQIHTIDGLCARLAARAPARPLSMMGLSVVDFPAPRYLEAARQAIREASRAPAERSDRIALEQLLYRERGDANSLLDLLAGMLPSRDQWLDPVIGASVPAADLLAQRQRLELAVLEVALGKEALRTAGTCLLTLAELADERSPDDEFPRSWRDAEADGGIESRVFATWLALRLLATAGNKLRKPSSLNSGVYRSADPDRAGPIDELKAIVGAWNDRAEAVAAFERFVKSPPLNRQPGDSSLLEHLRVLLKLACAQLDVEFSEHGVCDFQHVAQQALDALGDEQAPNEALLIEDGRLEHILIDEFQDTSHLQFELVRRLVSGWVPGDGRSLFLVGDPMQSIYRFRKAEVSLFADVMRSGALGEARLEPRRLAVNFRSVAPVLADVNDTCARLFQASSPASPGHVDYTPVQGFREDDGDVVTRAFASGDGDSGTLGEARWIAGEIRRLQQDHGIDTVGVLARKRKQLEPIAEALAASGIAFEAVEVESLAERPVVLDLYVVTRALLHPGDRVAWLALLNAPWVALQPDDLIRLAGSTGAGVVATILDHCMDKARVDGLAPEAAARVRRFAAVMAETRNADARAGLAARVESAWIGLGGPRLARRSQDLEDAERYLALLDRVERDRPDELLGQLRQRLDNLFASASPAPVKLMTIHKAKGLEFDAVFLPGLDGKPKLGDRRLFRQQDVSLDDGQRYSLLAPLKPSGLDQPTLYDYLGLLEQEAQDSEAQRLLYVAMTRARRFLRLSAVVATNNDGSLRRAAGSFMTLMHDRFAALVGDLEAPGPSPATGDFDPTPLVRLSLDEPDIAPAPVDGDPAALGEPFPDRERLALGEAVHRWLELVHDHWSEDWLGDWYESRSAALRSSLRLAGAPKGSIDRLERRLVDVLRGLLAREDLRSVFSPEGKARSEAEALYLVPEGSGIRRLIIDRLYQDAAGAWHVIDYKTGLSSEITRPRWRAQLDRYAAAVAEAEKGRVIERRILQAVEGRLIDPDD